MEFGFKRMLLMIAQKLIRRILIGIWILASLYLVYLFALLVSPFYTFHAIYRKEVEFGIGLQVVISLALVAASLKWSPFRFTIKSLFALVTFISIGMAALTVLNQHAMMKTGFRFSQTRLLQALESDGSGHWCGVYYLGGIARFGKVAILQTNGAIGSPDAAGFVYASDFHDTITAHEIGLDQSRLYPLGNGWYAFYSEYNFIKTGWS